VILFFFPLFVLLSPVAGSASAMVTDAPFVSQAAAISLCFVAILYGRLHYPMTMAIVTKMILPAGVHLIIFPAAVYAL
jgi:hypothetical protein